MNIMTKRQLTRAGFSVALIASMTAGMVTAKIPTVPVPPPGLISYYSNAMKNDVVGQEIVTYEGARYPTWGVHTAHQDQESNYCPPQIEM